MSQEYTPSKICIPENGNMLLSKQQQETLTLEPIMSQNVSAGALLQDPRFRLYKGNWLLSF